jgi:hypothetical protein
MRSTAAPITLDKVQPASLRWFSANIPLHASFDDFEMVFEEDIEQGKDVLSQDSSKPQLPSRENEMQRKRLTRSILPGPTINANVFVASIFHATLSKFATMRASSSCI